VLSTARLTAALVLVCLCAAGAATSSARELSFEERVRAQSAIERVYYAHQIGATKPFEDALPRAVLEAKVQNYLKQSTALDKLWHTPVTAEMLQAELGRMLRGSRMPERLQEIFLALGNDSVLIQECLARATLVDRLTRSFYAFDQRLHASTRDEIEKIRTGLIGGGIDPRQERPGRMEIEVVPGTEGETDALQRLVVTPARFEGWRRELGGSSQAIRVKEDREAFMLRVLLEGDDSHLRVAQYRVQKTSWDTWWSNAALELEGAAPTVALANTSILGAFQVQDLRPTPAGSACIGTWDNGSMDDLPDPRFGHTAVWTGSLMIVWGGDYGALLNTGGRYDPSTDTWTPTSTANAPEGRRSHTAVWTGDRMVVWGGYLPGASQSGGSYDPFTDTWTRTSAIGAPEGRFFHTAVWTGTEMLVWGGIGSPFAAIQTGGRYNPATDTWAALSLTGAPSARADHTAVWTGSSMVVWGGGPDNTKVNTGGRYDPDTDTWTPTSTLQAPSAMALHTAVWSGNRMIVWGKAKGLPPSGGRYDPSSDTWEPVSTTGAPTGSDRHAAVWTGQLMLVWGGLSGGVEVGTGGRYDPVTDAWTSISTVGAPEARHSHRAVWTGRTMVVWGGRFDLSGDRDVELNSGGRYDPATDTWTPTSTLAAPEGRDTHTSLWTGSLMVVWGGQRIEDLDVNTGGRYDPATDSWTATSTLHAPSARAGHTAVWTGSQMVVWGGGPNTLSAVSTGGRYNPNTDAWTPTSLTGAPSPRLGHTAVWTGARMIVWGGRNDTTTLNTGGRYDPIADTWTPTSITHVPEDRFHHSAVWTGTRMVVWGGFRTPSSADPFIVTGGQYDPLSDTWTRTSTKGAPRGRTGQTTIWTGTQMVIWGGSQYIDHVYPTGGRYDPAADTWKLTSLVGAAGARTGHSAVWTGSTMIVWGGMLQNQAGTNTGARYDPVANAWTPTSTAGTATARAFHTAIWTGNSMIVWGGGTDVDQDEGSTNTGGRFSLECP
jgi:N-acetylneuraminic acid mutarotase